MDKWGAKSEGRAAAGAPSVGQNHVRSVHRRIDEHFAARREIDRITNEIGLLTSQLRNVERRMLRAARERNEGSLADTGLPFLFDRTCRAIFALLEDLAKARTVRERAGHELRCSVELLLLVTRWNASDENYEALRAAIGFEPRPSDRLDWEETADAALTALLESTSRKSAGTETGCSSAWNALTPIATVRELSKLKTRLAHAIGRLAGARESDIAEMEANDVAESSA
ncbi:protein PTHB1-like [Frieseomelitta varia]|uniref:protein PTHB1-like n=1 Tax=Frieseomelitta varia TaxID=561572 RepID=UPI001CB67D57|nr:protein PTHB1-like [Frieseomelitta varia]